MANSQLIRLLFVLAMVAAAFSQKPFHRNYPITPFSSIVISGPMEVTIQYGKACQVTVDANYKWLLDRLSVVRKGKTLVVAFQGGINLKSKNDMPRVSIVTEKLTGIQALNTATVNVAQWPVREAKFTAVTSGVSTLQISSIKADTIYLTSKDVSTLRISGQANKLIIEANDMGTLEAGELTCETAYISADKMSNINVTVKGFAAATASEMSNINILGDARVEKEADFMSSVTCANCN